MKEHKRLITMILAVFAVYILMSIFLNNKVQAVDYRTTDLSILEGNKYKGMLALIKELQTAHPNWNFTIENRGLEWNDVLYAETFANHARSLTQNTSPEWLCPVCGTTPYDSSSGWYGASQQAVSYYLDPRNWLNSKNIFSFEALSYSPESHNIEGVNAILKGTFMDRASIDYINTEGNTLTIQKSYAQIIMEAAIESNVSPYHLASRLVQEQGSGKSALISGTYSNGDNNFTGYYNYFNIGASGNGDTTIITNGLTYARSNRWTSPEASIKGGASFIASGYISKEQDTLYFEKFDLTPPNIGSHQYMQNISAHISEGLNVYKAYNNIGVLEQNFNFIIPAYENMPETISARPTTEYNLVTENVVLTNVNSYANMRSGKATWYSILAEVPLGTVLLRIETAKSIQNGYYWDKVIYFKDNQAIMGYVARNYLLAVPDVITTDEAYYTSETAVLRNGPGVDAEVKRILDAEVLLTVIDKMTYAVDNMFWYRVKLDDGTEGYISSGFLRAIEQQAPTGEVYKIEGNNVIVVPGTKLEQIEGATTTSEVLGTGAKIVIDETEYTVVMLGDVNGDGVVKSKDYMLIKNYIMRITEFTEIEKMAADVNRDGEIKSKDYMIIKNHIMSISSINL